MADLVGNVEVAGVGRVDFVWTFEPEKLMSPERVAIEKQTGLTWGQWKVAFQEESVTAQHALVWVLVKRQHPTALPEAVSFCEADIEMRLSDDEARTVIAHYEQNSDPALLPVVETLRARLGDEPPKAAKKAKKKHPR